MYLCEVCHTPSGRGKPKLRFVLQRADRSILREVSVCPECHRILSRTGPEDGPKALAALMEINRTKPAPVPREETRPTPNGKPTATKIPEPAAPPPPVFAPIHYAPTAVTAGRSARARRAGKAEEGGTDGKDG